MKDDNDDYSDGEEDWSKPVSLSDDGSKSEVYTSPKPSTGTGTTSVTNKHANIEAQHLRTIIHIDMDCFYAQVEMIKNPNLANIPLGIQQKYIIVTCNYPARALGVNKLMSIKDARAKCPSLVLVSGEDLTDYRKMSYRISEHLLKYTKKVERLGFDENFLDVSDLVGTRMKEKTLHLVSGYTYGSDDKDVNINEYKQCSCGCNLRLTVGSQIASEIRQSLLQELGITCCAGISYNKLLAKLVAGIHKPNQQTTLFPDQSFQLVNSLPKAQNIPGIGYGMAKRLAGIGVNSVCDLFNCSKDKLVSEVGEQTAILLQHLSAGIDNTPVIQYGLPQSISDEDSHRKLSLMSEVEKEIKGLVTNVVKRVEEDGRYPQTLRVTIRKFTPRQDYSNGGRESRQCPISTSLFQHINKDKSVVINSLVDMSLTLFKKMVDITKSFHLTLINICVTKFTKVIGEDISSFFQHKTWQDEKQVISDMKPVETKVQNQSSPALNMSLTSPTKGIQDFFGTSSSKRKGTSPSELVNKRSKLDRNSVSTNTSFSLEQETDKRLVDLDVDLDVYNQLPEDIKKEILQSHTSHSNSSKSTSKSIHTESKRKRSLESFFSGKGSMTNKLKTTPPKLFETKSKVTKSPIQNKHSANSEESDKELCVSSIIIPSSSSSSSLSTEFCDTNVDECNNFIPPNIDKSVFINLPSDIQQELVNEWKHTNKPKISLNSDKQKKTNGILGYFKKK
ncbi:DNA polymerase iota [Patella vulgata]|uniref:DNA polymerase iota n=1 Tax=Patella vulgata TaxID=6465 RepID=UPI0024A8DC65|nr:DNA polymerase iota [Patella vulgata]XP_055956711.1 DNA polymerase iota [Patella vulgata]